jgi:hypothetical protein
MMHRSYRAYHVPFIFFCLAKRKRTKRKGETQKSCPAHMQTARPLLSCPIAPLAIKASLMTELVGEAHLVVNQSSAIQLTPERFN